MDTNSLIPTQPLTSADRCDSCGAQAYVQVFLEQGDLMFCAHHFKEYEDKLVASSSHIHNESHKLIPTKPEIEEVE